MISLSTLLIRQAGLQQAPSWSSSHSQCFGGVGGAWHVKGVLEKLCRAGVRWRGESEEKEQLQGRADLAGPSPRPCWPCLLFLKPPAPRSWIRCFGKVGLLWRYKESIPIRTWRREEKVKSPRLPSDAQSSMAATPPQSFLQLCPPAGPHCGVAQCRVRRQRPAHCPTGQLHPLSLCPSSHHIRPAQQP